MLAGVSPKLPALIVTAVLGGCSSGEDEAQPKPVKGAPKQVAEVIARLEKATAAGDLAAVCALFTRETRVRAGGSECAQSLSSRVGGVLRPSIRILSIKIGSTRSSVRIEAQASGQAPVQETIELVREDGRYLIDGLGP